jgi:LysR family transcriptional regulator, nod-box dependent transcriptional activator
MNLRGFDLNLLRSLDALLSERSVTRAADRVFVSQPTMSGALQRLREYFADQLLIRVGREMELTPLARSLAGPVHEVLQNIQATLEIRPSFDPATVKRVFRVAMTDYAAVILMPLVLQRLAQLAPYISCDIEPLTEAIYNNLASGDTDFVIAGGNWRLFGGPEPSAEIRSELLFSDSFVCVVDRNHPTVNDTLTLDEYRRLPHQLVRLGPGTESLIEHAWKVAELDMKVATTTGSFLLCICLIPGTPVVATTQKRLAQLLAAALPLKIVPCPVAVPALHEALMWHARNEFDPGHEFMRGVFAEAAAHLRGQ